MVTQPKRWGMRDLWESDGPEMFAGKVAGLLNHPDPKMRLRPQDINFTELAACIIGAPIMASTSGHAIREAITSTAFTVISGNVINRAIVDAYEGHPKIGYTQLVTVTASARKVERFAGFTALNVPKLVRESEPYPEDTLTEKYYTVENDKYGRIVALTEEAIKFDQTGELLNRASQLGEVAAALQDRIIVRGCIDAGSNVYDAGALYSAATYANTPSSTANLSAVTLEAAWVGLATMTADNSESGDIGIPVTALANLVLLCSKESYFEGKKLLAGINNPDNANNEPNVIKSEIASVTWSPWITTANSWFVGNFKRQFKYSEVFPVEIFSRSGQDTDQGFLHDVVRQWKVRFMGGIAAVDHRFVWKGK